MASKTKKKPYPTIPDRQLIHMQPAGSSVATYILFVHSPSVFSAEIIRALEAQALIVRSVPDGETCLITVKENRYDLILIDGAEPFTDLASLIKTLRMDGLTCPIVLATPALTEKDRNAVSGAGCDDYLIHPFTIPDLMACITTLLQRPLPLRETVLRVGTLELDLIDRTAFREGRKIHLLAREFKLLEYMMRRPAQVLSRAMLLEEVWNYRFEAETNLVDVHMGKLRKKIDGASQTPLIHTIKGLGFMLSPTP